MHTKKIGLKDRYSHEFKDFACMARAGRKIQPAIIREVTDYLNEYFDPDELVKEMFGQILYEVVSNAMKSHANKYFKINPIKLPEEDRLCHLAGCTKDFRIKYVVTKKSKEVRVDIFSSVPASVEDEAKINKERKWTKAEFMEYSLNGFLEHRSVTGYGGLGVYQLSKMLATLQGKFAFYGNINGWSGYRLHFPFPLK